MKALYYNELKSYQGINLGNFPQPEVSDNEVLVPVKAFSLDRLDVLVMKGKHAVQIPLPENLSSTTAEKAQIERTDNSGPVLFFACLAALRDTPLISIL